MRSSCAATAIRGDDALRTGLCIVTKRADTNSVWPLHNHPRGKAWDWLQHLPRMLMQAIARRNELRMQVMSESSTAREIDGEVGDLSGDLLATEPLMTCKRYNLRLEDDELQHLGVQQLVPRLPEIRRMSAADTLSEMTAVGAAAADRYVCADDFPEIFDRAGT